MVKIKKVGLYDGYRTNAFYGFNVPEGPNRRRHFNVPDTPSKYVPLSFVDSLEASFGMPRTYDIEPLSQVFEDLTISNSKTGAGFKHPLDQNQESLSLKAENKSGHVYKALKPSPFPSRLPDMNFSFEKPFSFPSSVKSLVNSINVKSRSPTSGYNSMDSNTLFKEILDTVSRISTNLEKQISNPEDSITFACEPKDREKSLNVVHNFGSFINSLDSSRATSKIEDDNRKKADGESVETVNNNLLYEHPSESSAFYTDFLELGEHILSSTPKALSSIGEEESKVSFNIFASTPFERHELAMRRTIKKVPKKTSLRKLVAGRYAKVKKRKFVTSKEMMAEQCAKHAAINEKMEESLEILNQGIHLISSVFEELSDHLRSFQSEVPEKVRQDLTDWKTKSSKSEQ